MIDLECQRASSLQVFVSNCCFVLAVTTPLRFLRQAIWWRSIQAVTAPFPMPWPEATADWYERPSPSLMCSPMSSNSSACHISGPDCPSKSPSPQGKTYLTKPRGSSWKDAMSWTSSCPSCGATATVITMPPFFVENPSC